MTQTYNKTQEGLVQNMRKIRDEISFEIKDMTFEQEREYLDKLLNAAKSDSAQSGVGVIGDDE